MQEDGCGQFVTCGENKGACTTSWDQCVKNKCVCEPKTCEGICGEIDTGCGKTETCTCSMSNEMCDEVSGMCINIPQPPVDPNLLGEPLPITTTPLPTTTVAEANKTALRGAPAPAAAGTTAPPSEASTTVADATAGVAGSPGSVVADMLGPLKGFDAPSPLSDLTATAPAPSPAPAGMQPPPPPPGLVPGTSSAAGPAAALNEEQYKYFVYYYNFYYYMHWNDLVTNQHMPAAMASRRAAALASAHAQEQMSRLTDPGKVGQIATAATDVAMQNAELSKENAQMKERLENLGQNIHGAPDPEAARAIQQQSALGKQLMDGILGEATAAAPSPSMMMTTGPQFIMTTASR